MKQYLDIEIGPMRNIADALRADIDEISFNRMTHESNQLISTNNPDVWSILHEKLIKSKQTKD